MQRCCRRACASRQPRRPCGQHRAGSLRGRRGCRAGRRVREGLSYVPHGRARAVSLATPCVTRPSRSLQGADAAGVQTGAAARPWRAGRARRRAWRVVRARLCAHPGEQHRLPGASSPTAGRPPCACSRKSGKRALLHLPAWRPPAGGQRALTPRVPARAQLLQLAGWREGRGLGAAEQGIASPLPAWHNRGRRGIGAPSQAPASSSEGAAGGPARPPEGPAADGGGQRAARAAAAGGAGAAGGAASAPGRPRRAPKRAWSAVAVEEAQPVKVARVRQVLPDAGFRPSCARGCLLPCCAGVPRSGSCLH